MKALSDWIDETNKINNFTGWSRNIYDNWEDLMDVVEHIHEETECFVTIYKDACKIHNIYPYKMNDIEVDAYDTKSAVIEAIIKYIDFHE